MQKIKSAIRSIHKKLNKKLNKIKQLHKKLASKAKKLSPKLWSKLKSLSSWLLILVLAVKAPEWHYSAVRGYVGNKVVKITKTMPNGRTGGGTGFHVQTPSGKTYILTNDHICEMSNDGYLTVSSSEQSRPIPRRIIERSSVTDLCLVEPLPNVGGLDVASSVDTGEIVAVVGHPKLLPLTMSRGEVIGEVDVIILDHIMDGDENDRCDLPKNKIMEFDTLFGPITACMISIKAYQTNAVILGGNSGSPVVNFWGNLVGVAFANEGEAKWGSFVSLKDIREFLKPY